MEAVCSSETLIYIPTNLHNATTQKTNIDKDSQVLKICYTSFNISIIFTAYTTIFFIIL
jgi:hypothetical protein